ncbi:MAG TPA: flagellar hook-length control protein FliK [Capsulimonadaceae bacterium]|jgi:flagellar hook-length control protein FliK
MPTIPAASVFPSGDAGVVNGASRAKASGVNRQSGGGKSREGQLVNDQGNAWTRLFNSSLKKSTSASSSDDSAKAASGRGKSTAKTDNRSSDSDTAGLVTALVPNADPGYTVLTPLIPGVVAPVLASADTSQVTSVATDAALGAASAASTTAGTLSLAIANVAAPVLLTGAPLSPVETKVASWTSVDDALANLTPTPAATQAAQASAAQASAAQTSTDTVSSAATQSTTAVVTATSEMADALGVKSVTTSGQKSNADVMPMHGGKIGERGITQQDTVSQMQMRDTVIAPIQGSAQLADGGSSDTSGSSQRGDSGESLESFDATTDPTSLGIAAAPTTATASAATPTTDSVLSAGREERLAVVQQVSRQISVMHAAKAAGTSGVTISLSPERWGDMKIDVKVTDDGSGNLGNIRGIEATLTAASSAVKEMLQSNTKELKSALEQNGMRLDKLNIVVDTTKAPATHSASAHDSSRQFSGQSDQSQQQTMQNAFSFSQGNGHGQTSQNMGGGFGQSGSNPASAALVNATLDGSATTSSDAAQGSAANRLVDYRI